MRDQAIHNIRTWDPKSLKDDVLLDDHRILIAWYADLRKNKLEKLSNGATVPVIAKMLDRAREEMKKRGLHSAFRITEKDGAWKLVKEPNFVKSSINLHEVLTCLRKGTFRDPIYVMGGVVREGFSNNDVDIFVSEYDGQEAERAFGDLWDWVHVVKSTISLHPGSDYVLYLPDGKVERKSYLANVVQKAETAGVRTPVNTAYLGNLIKQVVILLNGFAIGAKQESPELREAYGVLIGQLKKQARRTLVLAGQGNLAKEFAVALEGWAMAWARQIHAMSREDKASIEQASQVLPVVEKALVDVTASLGCLGDKAAVERMGLRMSALHASMEKHFTAMFGQDSAGEAHGLLESTEAANDVASAMIMGSQSKEGYTALLGHYERV